MFELEIGGRKCSTASPLYFAEEAQANQGSIELALRMIDLAAEVGADGIEFQLFWAEDMYVRGHRGFDIYRKAELSEVEISSLISRCAEKKLLFQAACLSTRMVEFCAVEGVDTFIINATDLNNPYMLDAVAAAGTPFWLATLMGTEAEIDWAVNHLTSKGTSNFGILHGQHSMTSGEYKGVPPEMAQLDCIGAMQEKYGRTVGYVDHTPTIHMPGIAVAKGASFVTKHLAPEINWTGPDAAVALAPEEWKASRRFFDYVHLCSGASKELSQAERGDRSKHRRGLYSRKKMAEGHRLQRSDIVALRPGEGAINPVEIENLVGRKLRVSIEDNQAISFDHLVQEG